MAKRRQCLAVLEWLRAGWPLTQEIASKELGIRRLASRISDLKRKGYGIDSRMIKTASRWNEPGRAAVTKVAEYRLTRDIPGPSYWERAHPRVRSSSGWRPDAPAPAQAPPSAPPAVEAASGRAGTMTEEQPELFR